MKHDQNSSDSVYFPQIDAGEMLTPPGRGGVATIRVQGDLRLLEQQAVEQGIPYFQAKNGKQIWQQELNRILFGQWREEELVGCRVSENCFEIHCHGGQAAISRIQQDLNQICQKLPLQSGAMNQQPNSEIHFNKKNSLARESVEAVRQAKTFRTVEWLWQQTENGTGFWELLEAYVHNQQNNHQSGNTPPDPSLLAKAAQSRKWINFGRHLTAPWSVVIGGEPNVGKSSLINALLGYERAIVFDSPGTTRDIVRGETAIDGWPVIFSDTAGQRQTEDRLETAGIELAVESLKKADLQILVIDRSQPVGPQTAQLLERFPEALKVFNKSDLPAHIDWQASHYSDWLAVSCRAGTGISELLQTISNRLVPALPDFKLVIPISLRQQELLEQFLKMFSDS